MALINENYLKLPANYLFKEIGRKVNVFQTTHPQSRIIHLDSGDSHDISGQAVIQSLQQSVAEMSDIAVGQQVLSGDLAKKVISRIIKVDYEEYGVRLGSDEFFLSNNAMNVCSELCDVFSTDNVLAFLDPSYPAYIYSAVMAGRSGRRMADGRWENFVYVTCDWSNGFLPEPPKEHCDVIYLNLPHNPTGSAFPAELLKRWVKYAASNKALIIYEASHAHYITSSSVPHSIFEIKGAKKVAVEIRSFSKTTGFTGTNFAFLVIPKDVMVYSLTGEGVALNTIWQRRHISQFGGIPYITMRSAEALYSDQGVEDRKRLAAYYMANAALLRDGLSKMGFRVQGGVDSPYVWVKCPNNMGSWNLFERLLYEANIVCSPGVGFCPGGEGAIRLTSFNTRENVLEALERLRRWKR